MEVHDLINQQDEFNSFKCNFNLWPERWTSIKDIGSLNWQTYPFDIEYIAEIPALTGIYSLVINPGVTNHPQRYLCYIGKSDRTLRDRYLEYLRESNNIKGRPKLLRLLNKWKSYIEFCYVPVQNGNAKELEEKLLDAFIPPFNSIFSAEINKVVKAFN